MSPFILCTIIFLSILFIMMVIVNIINIIRHKKYIKECGKIFDKKDEKIQKLQRRLTDDRADPDPISETKLKRYYFTTEQSLELARLWDQTNDRTKDSEAMALLWKRLEQIRPEAVYPSAFLGTGIPIRFYLEWDENDKDPLKEQK